MKSHLLPSALLVVLHSGTSAPAASSATGDGPIHHSRSHRAAHKAHAGSAQTGMASYYSMPQRVTSGGYFNPNAMTAAHRALPFGTRVRVTHMGNGRSVVVHINDRGPYGANRILDLSKAAAQVLGMTGQGIARVKMSVLGR